MQKPSRQLMMSVTMLLCVFTGNAAQHPFVSATHISLKISTSEAHNPKWEPIEIHYVLRNTSTAAVFVPKSQWDVRCPSQPHFWARLVDSFGKSYETGYAGDCLGHPGERMDLVQRMRVDATLLRPGESAKGTFIFNPEALPNLMPGKYRLEATLYGWNALDPTEVPSLSKMGHPVLTGETHATMLLWLDGSQ